MRLTQRTDIALRGLIHLGLVAPQQLSAGEMASALEVSPHHLTKSLQALRHAGFVESQRGQAGGHRLARSPAAIAVGAVVRALEKPDLVECFRPDGACVLTPACRLAGAFQAAVEAFYRELDRITLADLLSERAARLLKLGS